MSMAPQTYEQYRTFLATTSWYTHTDEGNASELMYLTLGLAGESGEFADAVKKIIRKCGSRDSAQFAALMEEPMGKEKLFDEAGDVLWYLVKLLGFLGVSLEDLIVHNTYKLYNRLIERGHFTAEEMPWPFTDPVISYENVHENETRRRTN